jgi:asparagine synthetase B (glutamine-hydrolysing)
MHSTCLWLRQSHLCCPCRILFREDRNQSCARERHLLKDLSTTRPGVDPARLVSNLPASLSGILPFGGSAQLRRSAGCRTWPEVIRHAGHEIAIDGYFVLGNKLYLGRTKDEQIEIAGAMIGNLSGFLERVQNGFFNAVINNLDRGTTSIVSDRFGALPLYLLRRHDRLFFASTYAGLQEIVPAELEPDAIGIGELYWLGYQLGDRTSYRGVEHIPAGTTITVQLSNGAERRERWVQNENRTAVASTKTEMAEQLVDVMATATRRLKRPNAVYGAKVSAGMDSRLICGSWPDSAVHAYTFGYPNSAEVKISGRLSRALGMRHTMVPIEGDFFSRLHAPLFALHGLTEFFHQALVPAMQHDGVEFALDGLAGDVLLGGLTLRRSHTQLRQALGMNPKHETMPSTDDEIAGYILRQIRVPDRHYRPLTREALEPLDKIWNDIHADMVAEVSKIRATAETFEQIYTGIMFRNRTRRYISLQGTLCRPQVESLYPFLDRDFLRLEGLIPPEWVANKRLYIDMYSRFLPKIRSIPTLLSLLPFTVPGPVHYAGRIVRYGLEQVGLHLSYRTGGRINLWAANGMQWARWMAFDEAFRNGARSFMRRSRAFDDQAFEDATRYISRGPTLSGTRFMLTSSYCGYFC